MLVLWTMYAQNLLRLRSDLSYLLKFPLNIPFKVSEFVTFILMEGILRVYFIPNLTWTLHNFKYIRSWKTVVSTWFAHKHNDGLFWIHLACAKASHTQHSKHVFASNLWEWNIYITRSPSTARYYSSHWRPKLSDMIELFLYHERILFQCTFIRPKRSPSS